MFLPKSLSMNRLLALIPAAVLLLAGCGGDTCTSAAAPLKNTSGESCTLTPGATATIQVELCGKCSDSGGGCQAEFLPASNPDHLEVAPTVQQCQANAGCAISGCNISVPTATCQVAVPAGLTGDMPIQVVGETTATGQLNFGSGTSCTL